jgi:uncharacterized cupredoxin-like copper-binding protein/N-acetylneuraminic acid mutarotase
MTIGFRKATKAVLSVVLMVALVITVGPTPVAGTTVTLTITMRDALAFEPDSFSAAPGDTVSLTIINAGALTHTFTLFAQADANVPVDDFDALQNYYNANTKIVDLILAAGEQDAASFTAPMTEGRYTFVCMTPGHAAGGMHGHVTIAVAEPAARSYHAMAYDSESDRVVLFGGLVVTDPPQAEVRDDTWAYDVNTDTWTNMDPVSRPSPRFYHVMAYDSESDRVVLFGGFTATGTFSDETWTYDLNTNSWTNVTPAVGPSGRANQGMAYDAESDRVVLFGGSTGFPGGTAGDVSDETWTYDLNTNSWTNVTPAVGPSARIGHVMAYDTESDQIVLFGGSTGVPQDFPENLSDDTWTFDLNTNTWTNMTPATGPSARSHLSYQGMAYDAESDRIVLFSGFHVTGVVFDTWTYDTDTNTWTDVTQATSPSAFVGHAMVYDTESDRVILFGGSNPITGNLIDETWAYDLNTNTWTNMDPATGPSAPPNLQATAGDAQVDLTWQPPSDDGGSSITNYRIYRGTTSGDLSLLDEVGNVLTYVDTDVINDITYYYAVAGVNAVGEGPQSTEVPATPVDTTKPTITISSPVNGATLNSTSVAVSGTASDNVEVEKVELTIDEMTWVLATGTTSWSGTLALAEGPNTIFARATDTAGNTATVSIAVTVDTTTPIVSITSPADGATLGSASVVVSGTASDNGAVEKVELSLDGTNYVSATGTTSWSGTLALAEGPNTIFARATDTAGNTATVSIVVTVDTVKPTAVAGEDQTVNAGAMASFDASASSDDVAIVSYEWDFGDGTTGTGETTTHIYTDPGTFTVTLTVRDAAGNADTDVLVVIVETEPVNPIPPEVVTFGVVGAIAAAAAGVALLLWRRRAGGKGKA